MFLSSLNKNNNKKKEQKEGGRDRQTSRVSMLCARC